MAISYLHQAVDSVTHQLVQWTTGTHDWSGSTYPGPNEPLEIAIIGRNGTADDGGNPDLALVLSQGHSANDDYRISDVLSGVAPNDVTTLSQVEDLIEEAAYGDIPEFFGAVGDGVADDTAAVQAWIGSLDYYKGGALRGKNGSTYRITDTILFGWGRSNVRIDLGGATILADLPSGDSDKAAIDMRATSVCSWKSFNIRVGEDFDGIVFDLRGPAGATFYFAFEDFYISGPEGLGHNADVCFALESTVWGQFHNGRVLGGKYGITGRAYAKSTPPEAVAYANVIKLENIIFQYQTDAAIYELGDSWSLDTCTFEPALDGSANPIVVPSGSGCFGVSITSCWFGDDSLAGRSWISLEGSSCFGIHISGCESHSASTFLDASAGGNGIKITGNSLYTASPVITLRNWSNYSIDTNALPGSVDIDSSCIYGEYSNHYGRQNQQPDTVFWSQYGYGGVQVETWALSAPLPTGTSAPDDPASSAAAVIHNIDDGAGPFGIGQLVLVPNRHPSAEDSATIELAVLDAGVVERGFVVHRDGLYWMRPGPFLPYGGGTLGRSDLPWADTWTERLSLPGYTVATLPDPGPNGYKTILVLDGNPNGSGPSLATSDGGYWRRPDGNVVGSGLYVPYLTFPTGRSIAGKPAAGAGLGTEITAGDNGVLCTDGSGAIAFQSIKTAMIADSQITSAKIVDGSVTPAKQSLGARTGHRIYKTVTGDTTLTASDWTDGGVAYDPAQSELVVSVNGTSGTITVTLPTDAALVAGCRVTAKKGNANAFAVVLAAAVIQNSTAGGTSTSSTLWAASATQTGLAFTYEYSGAAWCALGLPGRNGTIDYGTLGSAAGNTVLLRSANTTGSVAAASVANGNVLLTRSSTTQGAKVQDDVCQFESPSSYATLDSVAPATRVGNASLADAGVLTVPVTVATNNQIVTSTFQITLGSGNGVIYSTIFYRDGAGTITGRLIPVSPVGDLPTPIAVVVTISTGSGVGNLLITNNTGGPLNVQVDPTTSRRAA